MKKFYVWTIGCDYDVDDAVDTLVGAAKQEAGIRDIESLVTKIMEAKDETSMDKMFACSEIMFSEENVSCYIDNETTRWISWTQISSWDNGDDYGDDMEGFNLYISSEPREDAVEVEI